MEILKYLIDVIDYCSTTFYQQMTLEEMMEDSSSDLDEVNCISAPEVVINDDAKLVHNLTMKEVKKINWPKIQSSK